MNILKLVNDDEEVIFETTISSEAFEQLSNECPIIRFNGQQFTYIDVAADFMIYAVTREFTVAFVDDDETVVKIFETTDRENVL